MESFDDITRDDKSNASNTSHVREVAIDGSFNIASGHISELPPENQSNASAVQSPAVEELRRVETQDDRRKFTEDAPLYPQLTHQPLESPRAGAQEEHESDDEDK